MSERSPIDSVAYALCEHDENGDGGYGNDHLADLIVRQLRADRHVLPTWQRAHVWHVDDEDRELYGPSVDVCAWCGDCECDGVACIASLDPDSEDDQAEINRLHAWIRRGRFFEQVERVLAECENRPVPPKFGAT